MTSQAQSEKKLCFVTWNTNGIKGNIKKTSDPKFLKVLSSLSTLKADIAFIQETHIGPECHEIFKEANNWTVYFTVYSPISKGVAILINKDTDFKYICHDEDCSGGYIVLFCYLYGELYTLVNVYNHKADKIILGRLKEYLTETAEGVLVIGGDFNTVLHPHLDRKPSTSRQSPFRAMLEDFITSLNLKDTWSHLHPNKEGFTRRQNESSSRIDMFFIPEDKTEQECSITVGEEDISDHKPLVLELTIQVQKNPNVAKDLRKGTYNPDRTAGKISGAEILSAIKSLTYKHRSDGLKVYTDKRSPHSETEILKIHFNNILKGKRLSRHLPSQHWSHIRIQNYLLSFLRRPVNVSYSLEDMAYYYSIFIKILAERLIAFIDRPFAGEKNNIPIVFRLTLERGEQEIRWSFLREVLQNLKPVPSAPPPDFGILYHILPKVPDSEDQRLLRRDCPLSSTILNLALNEIQRRTLEKRSEEIISMTTFCHQRQVLLFHTNLEGHDKEQKIEVKNKFFRNEVKKSGLKSTTGQLRH